MKYDHRPFEAPVLRRRAADAYGASVEARVQRFLPMVRGQAWHLHGSGRSDFDIDDLMQAGLVALTECARKHEGPGEDGFAAYAKLRVRGAMVDLIRRSATGSRGAAERRRRIEAATLALRGTLGREPEAAEIAEKMEITLGEFNALRDTAQPPSFAPLDDVYADSDARFGDPAPDSLAVLLAAEQREGLIAAIAGLPERLQMVVQLYFVEELSLSDIAEVMTVSIPRVHQLKARALELLREAMADVVELR